MGALLTSNWAPNTAWIHGTVTEKLNTKKSIQISRLGTRRLQAIKPAEPPQPIDYGTRGSYETRHAECHELLTLPPPASTQHGSRQRMRCLTMSAITFTKLRQQRQKCQQVHFGRKLPDGQLVSVDDKSWLFGTRCCACPPSLSDTPFMHGGRLISFVLVAHALLTTACICYNTSATSHTLHKQALYHTLFPHATRYWCWSIVLVGAGSLLSSLSCAPSAAAELGARICAVPSSLCRTGGNRLFNLVLLICVRYKAATYKTHF
jgi:hypothetical protein